jgi:hypothetical protein
MKWIVLAFACLLTVCGDHLPVVKWEISAEMTPLLPEGFDRASIHQLRTASHIADVCGKWPRSPAEIRSVLKSAGVSGGTLLKHQQFIDTMAGCSSWYELTDRNLSAAFPKIREKTGDLQKFHCVSVGFLQPWFLLANVNCESLTIVDISHHSLNLQFQLIQEMLASGAGFQLADFIKRQKFEYAISRHKLRPPPNTKLSLTDICSEGNAETCERTLAEAASRIKSLTEVRLVWGTLQGAVGQAVDPLKENIFYLSNSIDEKFTTEAEFLVFSSLYAKASRGRGFLIYHMASGPGFAIYRAVDPGKIETLCADKFSVFGIPFRRDPCAPQMPLQSFEMLTWADKLARERTNNKKNFCSK